MFLVDNIIFCFLNHWRILWFTLFLILWPDTFLKCLPFYFIWFFMYWILPPFLQLSLTLRDICIFLHEFYDLLNISTWTHFRVIFRLPLLFVYLFEACPHCFCLYPLFYWRLHIAHWVPIVLAVPSILINLISLFLPIKMHLLFLISIICKRTSMIFS